MTPTRSPGRDLAWSGVDSLWPAESRRLTRRPGRSAALLVLPNRRSPRLLVPTRLPSAGTMLVRHSRSRRQRLGQALVGRAVSSGLLPLLPVWRIVPRDDDTGVSSIQGYVRTQLPNAAAVGVLLGPPRANAKPVLRIFDEAGQTVAFGKIGHNELTAALVRHEGMVLAELAAAGFATLDAPKVLHAGTWRDLEVLLISALPSGERTAPSWTLPLPAMRELAEHGGLTSCDVSSSPYLARLRDRAAALPLNSLLAAHLPAVAGRIDGTRLQFGRWHGDWAPWNMGASEPLSLWDWERSETDVPAGFDVVHFLVQAAFKDKATAPAAVYAVRSVSGPALQRWCHDSEQVEATILLYLCEILARYVADGGADPAPVLQARISMISAMLTEFTGVTATATEESHVDA